MIEVKRDNAGNIVIEDKTSKTRLVLKPYQGVFVLKKLADELGFRVSLSKPMVKFKLEAMVVRVWLTEGRQTRMFVIPLDVLATYITILQSVKQTSSRIPKRELAGMVVNELVKKYDELKKFISSGAYDWEKFFGSRTEYYVYFHVPVLVLESLGLVKLTSKHVQINDTIMQVSQVSLKNWLSKK